MRHDEEPSGDDIRPVYTNYAGMMRSEDEAGQNDKRSDESGISVQATSILYPERSTKLDNIEVEGFRAGGRELKGLVEATVDGRHISLISRSYRDEYVEKWQQYRAEGLPVVPTLRVEETDGQKRLLLTDLKADGSELYGRNLLGSFSQRYRAPDQKVDQAFLNLTTDENFKQIEEKAAALTALATEHRIALEDADALEMLVRPDGSWDLVMIDLDRTHVEEDPLHIPQVGRVNEEVLEVFKLHLREIRRRLGTME